MSSRNTVLSVLQNQNANKSAMNSAFDNLNTKAAEIEGKKKEKKGKSKKK